MNEFSKATYRILIRNKTTTPWKSEKKWEIACGEHENITIDWPKAYTWAFLSTKDKKLRTFQFKFLHRRIATNDFLYKVGITSNDLCSFCNLHLETLEHIFWSCPFTQAFWINVTEWINLNTPSLQTYHFPISICLGLVPIPDKMLINQTLLIARHYIYAVGSEATFHNTRALFGFSQQPKKLNKTTLTKLESSTVSVRNERS